MRLRRSKSLRADCVWRVQAWDLRHKISPAPGSDPDRAGVGQRLVFIAEPLKLYQIRIACVLPDGSVPPEVQIVPKCLAGTGRSDPEFTWTPEQPVASFLCPSVELSASCSIGGREFRSDPLEVKG